MVELFYTLIKQGRKTIEDVPEKYKNDVLALLEKDNAQFFIKNNIRR